MKLSELIYDDELIQCESDKGIEIKKIVTNPNDVDEDTLLIIPNIEKVNSDIHFKVLPIAIASESPEKLTVEVPKLKLINARASVAKAYYRFYNIENIRFKTIAITGTNGKTSTARFIKKILEECEKKVGYIGTGTIEIGDQTITEPNYSMTTPDPELFYSVLNRMNDEKCDVVIMEISSHALALEKVCPMTFDYAIFTNLSSEHGDFHKTIQEYFDAKCKLFKQCRNAIFNIDDEYARRAYKLSDAAKKITVGAIHKGDIFATHVENKGADGTSYLYRAEGYMFRMSIGIPGIYNVYNSMLAAAVCIDIGCPPYIAREAVRKLKCISGRFEIIKSDITVIIDFAHTEHAFKCFLREAKKIAGANALSVVFGCGGDRDREKRPKMATIAELYADRIFITNDNPRNELPEEIAADIFRGFTKTTHDLILDRKEAIEKAISTSLPGEVVAIIGKGAEKYMIDKDGYHTFDEKIIISEALRERRVGVKCESN